MRRFGERPDEDVVFGASVHSREGVSADAAKVPPGDNATRQGSGEQALISKRVIADLMMCVDGAVIFGAAVLAKWGYINLHLGAPVGSAPYAVVAVVGAVVSVVMLRYRGLYQFHVLSHARGQAGRVVFGLFATALALMAAGYLLKISEDYSRVWFALWFALSTVAVLTLHLMGARILQWWGALGWFSRHVVVYGSGEIAEKLIRKVGSTSMNLRVVGVFDDLRNGESPEVPVRGGLSDLIAFGQRHRVDEVLIAMPLTDELRIADLVEQLSLLPSDIRICPSSTSFRIPPKGLLNYQGLTVLELERRPLDDWAPIMKNIEDRVLGALLLAGLAPLLLLIAVAIKLDSRGPVIFKQRRHGFNHEVFNVYKFRTMYVCEDGETTLKQATRHDPRVTRVGRFLRKTSLDELPQLVNVLKGDMSLVGPRPHALSHNEYYSSVLARYANRHKVKPGMTGWAQVNGYRGETGTPEKMRHRVEHDLYYIEHWSVWFDLKVLAMTPFYGFIGRNAF
jgi:Undecaprenyl-phosphate glucose phosphotransferase